MRKFLYVVYTVMFTSVLLLMGCSGGGGGSAPVAPAPTAPTAVNMTVSGKSLDFTWTAGSNVDHYRIMVNPDGASGFTVDPAASNIVNTATNHSIEVPVHRVNWLAAQYIVEACNADESTCIASANQTLALIDSVAATLYVKASNTGAGDWFGYSVALSGDGNTLAVGALNEDSVAVGIGGSQAGNTAVSAGAVYVFARVAGAWSQQAYVKASNTGANDGFGSSVSLSGDGNTLAVGAYSEDSVTLGIGGNQADNAATNAGAVYVFARVTGVWSQQAYVKALNTGAGDLFGYSVALSDDGNTLAVGAHSEASAVQGIGGNQADNAATKAGAVYVFARVAGAWSQQAYVKASNTGAGDLFGVSVALSGDGNTLAVVALDEGSVAVGIGGNQADNTAASAGAVYLY